MELVEEGELSEHDCKTKNNTTDRKSSESEKQSDEGESNDPFINAKNMVDGIGSFLAEYKDDLKEHTAKCQKNVEVQKNEVLYSMEREMKPNKDNGERIPRSFGGSNKNPQNVTRLQKYYGDVEELYDPEDLNDYDSELLDKKSNLNDHIEEINKNEFYCEICDIRMNGKQSFDAHIRGNKHFKKLKKIQEASQAAKKQETKAYVEPIITESSDLKPVDVTLSKIVEPLIGLQFIVELKSKVDNEPRYLCELCDKKADMRTLESHLISYVHRWNYIKLNYPYFADEIREFGPKKSDRTPHMSYYSERIEYEENKPRQIKRQMIVDAKQVFTADDAIQHASFHHGIDIHETSTSKSSQLDQVHDFLRHLKTKPIAPPSKKSSTKRALSPPSLKDNISYAEYKEFMEFQKFKKQMDLQRGGFGSAIDFPDNLGSDGQRLGNNTFLNNPHMPIIRQPNQHLLGYGNNVGAVVGPSTKYNPLDAELMSGSHHHHQHPLDGNINSSMLLNNQSGPTSFQSGVVGLTKPVVYDPFSRNIALNNRNNTMMIHNNYHRNTTSNLPNNFYDEYNNGGGGGMIPRMPTAAATNPYGILGNSDYALQQQNSQHHPLSRHSNNLMGRVPPRMINNINNHMANNSNLNNQNNVMNMGIVGSRGMAAPSRDLSYMHTPLRPEQRKQVENRFRDMMTKISQSYLQGKPEREKEPSEFMRAHGYPSVNMQHPNPMMQQKIDHFVTDLMKNYY